MRVALVDDERYALEGLRLELEDLGGIEVVGQFEDGQSLLDQVRELQPDLILLDIEMPVMNGFAVFQRLMEMEVEASIVFITAYSQYAIQAFEINAVDYLVKPVTGERLRKTIERVRKSDLSIRCFGPFSIRVGERELNAGWRTRKAEELIAYLLCQKGRFVSKEKLAEVLWPEQDGEKGLSNLYLAYYYIKKQGKSSGVFIPMESERGKMRINLEKKDCDLLAFDRLTERTGDVAAMEQAVALYQGPIFENAYYPWLTEYQQRYEVHYEDILSRLMEYYKKEGNQAKWEYYNDRFLAWLK
jgi:two-component SAPR family response regulator